MARSTSGVVVGEGAHRPRPGAAGLEPHGHHAVARHPAPSRGRARCARRRRRCARPGAVAVASVSVCGRPVSDTSSAISSRSGNSDSCRTSDSPEKPTPTRRIGPTSSGIEQQPAGRRDQRGGVGGGVRQRRRAGQRAHVRLLQLDRDGARAAAVLLQPLVCVLADRARRLAQLIQGRQVLGKRRLGADLLGRPVLGDRPVVDATGQPVQRGPDRAAEDVGGLGVRQRGERADGLDAEPVQLLLGDRADPPQPAHRQAVQQRPLLVAAHHPDAVGLGQPGGDLGDLLSRPGADRGDQSGLVADLGPQLLAEPRRPPRRRRPVRPARRTPRRRTAARAPAPLREPCRSTRRLATP